MSAKRKSDNADFQNQVSPGRAKKQEDYNDEDMLRLNKLKQGT